MERAERTQPPGPAERLAGEDELLRRFSRTRDPVARDELVERFLPFARGLALRYRGGSEPSDDLIQVASLGLVKALDRFDPERGIPFTAFAAPTILGELKRHFRDRVWTLRVPRGLQERIGLVEEAIRKLTGELGRSPSVGEIAEKLDVDPADVLEVLEASQSRRTLSLEGTPPGGDTEEISVAERLGEDDPGFETVEHREALREGLPALSERERTVLHLRFVEDLTQSQIAERIGYSQMHVSRILRGALQRLRDAVGADELDA